MPIISSPMAHLMALFRSQVEPVTFSPAHLSLNAGSLLPVQLITPLKSGLYGKAPAGRLQEVVRCFNDASPIADVKLSYRCDPPLSCSSWRAIPSTKLTRPCNIPDQVRLLSHSCCACLGGVEKDKYVE